MPDSRPILAVDIGNTFLKVALLGAAPAGELRPVEKVFTLTSNEPQLDQFDAWLPPSPARWLVASVQRRTAGRLAMWVAARRPADEYRPLAHHDFPMPVAVEFPEKLGLDRLAAAMAANVLRPAGEGAIVIDAGSAVTVDAVSREGVFLGGAILPGLQMAARSLHEQTDALPHIQLDPANPPAPIGRSTEPAIAAGLYWGLAGGVKELVSQISRELGGSPLVVVGGGAGHLLRDAVPNARHVPELVFRGIALLAE